MSELLRSSVSTASQEADADTDVEPAIKRSQADKLTDLLLKDNIELTHDAAGNAYAVAELGDCVRATYRIRSREFNAMMLSAFYQAHRKAPSTTAIADAKNLLEARAIHEGHRVEVAVRIAGDDASISIDLGDNCWKMVHVTRDGWTIAPHGERLFRRAPGMLPLPVPIRGGNLAELRQFLRVDDYGFALSVSWLLCSLRPRGPYPLLLLGGEQGSAKTTTARLLRSLVDPNTADVRAETTDVRDLAIAANNAHVIALDNLSRLTAAMSDALCRLSTGGGFSTRRLYSDDEEAIFGATRPVIITSIADVVSRADLLDRALSVRLCAIPDVERRDEAELWERYEELRPRILGALLDGLVVALGEIDTVKTTTVSKPRMADAYLWALAASTAFGIDRSILERAWWATRNDAIASVLEDSVIAAQLRALLERELADAPLVSLTATQLLETLSADESVSRQYGFPKSARSLAGEVRRLAPALRATGINHQEGREPKTGRRLHVFSLAEKDSPNIVTHRHSVTNGSVAPIASDAGDGGDENSCDDWRKYDAPKDAGATNAERGWDAAIEAWES